jgi:signal transduction histidine kinase
LHDTIAHALVAINIRAGVAAHLGTGNEDAAAFADIKQISADALHDLRETLDLLREPEGRPPTQPAQDLADLPELFTRVTAGGLDAQLDLRTDGASIPSPVAQAAYRIVQESLTNVLRHAHATRARASIRVVRNVLEIEVTDDGRGGHGESSGHGLSGMTERAHALGGRVVAGPRATTGWAVRAELPLGRPG